MLNVFYFREVDPIIFFDREKEYSGQCSQGNHALFGELCQGQSAK